MKEKRDEFQLADGKTRAGALLFGLGLSLPWLLAAPALMLRFGL
jgi:hypothetical protein